ncbi:FAD/NAD(P)-binding oxidoreductase [Kribbella sp. NPDC050124]|uniref:FAD/NAD(P)-binding oxidoreductase n=1 Tax=Kribbella sp. NPDC050124 TaxID=3364114 RepID=UPI0037AF1B02
MRIVVVGGSDAGISAALRARECAPESTVTILVADTYLLHTMDEARELDDDLDQELADEITADAVLVVRGVRPNSELAAAAGVQLNNHGTIIVDRHMRTNLPDVWAAGDCVHTHHVLLAEPTYVPLGTTAHKQGRVAGENAAGGSKEFAGIVGYAVALQTGLTVEQLLDLDLAYTPPLGSPWDAIQLAAQHWLAAR